MAGVTEMLAGAFWNQIQKLQTLSTRLKADLADDKRELTALWSETKLDPNPARAALHQRLLSPRIHRNSELRIQYQGLAAKFNQAVESARAALARAGYTAPANLSGFGITPVLVTVGAVAGLALAAALAIYAAVRTATDAQRVATHALADIIHDPTATAAQKEIAARALATGATTPSSILPGFDLGALALPLALIAAIVIVPAMLPKRRAA